jgi:hypothetical protein
MSILIARLVEEGDQNVKQTKIGSFQIWWWEIFSDVAMNRSISFRQQFNLNLTVMKTVDIDICLVSMGKIKYLKHVHGNMLNDNVWCIMTTWNVFFTSLLECYMWSSIFKGLVTVWLWLYDGMVPISKCREHERGFHFELSRTFFSTNFLSFFKILYILFVV